MSALLINFKIDDFQELLNEIDDQVQVLKNRDGKDDEFISVTYLKNLLENYVRVTIIDTEKI